MSYSYLDQAIFSVFDLVFLGRKMCSGSADVRHGHAVTTAYVLLVRHHGEYALQEFEDYSSYSTVDARRPAFPSFNIKYGAIAAIISRSVDAV